MIELSKILNNPLADKINNISDFVYFAQNALSVVLVRPQKDEGMGGFLFDLKGREGINLQSDITDHYIEDNTAVNDHIALKPETYTVNGFVGELKDIRVAAASYIGDEYRLKGTGDLYEGGFYTDRLQSLGPFAPEITSTARALYNNVERLYGIYEAANKTAVNTWGKFKDIADGTELTEQQKAFKFFYAQWQARAVFTVQTAWHTFEYMAIQTLTAEQEEESNVITDFNITFKKLRYTGTLTRAAPISAGRAKEQKAEQKDKGVKKPLVSQALQRGREFLPSIFGG
jgi:hypothetical protein